MKASSTPKIKRQTAIVGWLTIFTQAALPLSFAYTPLVNAASSSESSASKWYQSGANAQNGKSFFDDNNDSLASTGSALSQDGSGSVATGMARSAATGAVNNSVEEWLSQFGTARVQLNLDDKFKAEGSEADLLIPVYETKSTILFTQLGFRHMDSRNTGNIGVGARHFVGDWMLGANTFFDNDFTGENRRMGVGVEAWRDYLKLSANSYMRLSSWHQSRDFEDYDERPANGYDVRAEGWLPAFPQLGAKVMFEQYQGDEVALFGKDNRQKDPWAFTGGVTYTPIPLVSVGAQHRAGKAGQNDSQVSLQLNYRLGESWSKQVDPNLVGASRTLNGSRYDLVERNNNIVLDYRKQETVKLVLPEKTSGKSRSTVPLSFTVNSKHPLQRIDWDASTLVAAGGSITQVGSNQLSVTLPGYQAGGSNVYRFAGVAYDVKGNSGSATADIQVEVGDVQASSTKVSANPTSIVANGISTSTLSIELFDDQGNPVSGMAKSLKASLKEVLVSNQPSSSTAAQAATLGAIDEASPGVYQAVLTSGTRIGSVVVSPQFNDTALPEITISENADAATGHVAAGAILATVDNNIANNTAMNQVRATITDATGNPLPNTAITFSLTGSATVAPGSSLNATTDENGLVNISFIDRIAETVTVTATLENGNSGSVDTHFIADSSTASMSNGDVSVDKNIVVANNADIATFSAVVKDANGNVVPNFTVNWTNDKGTLSGASSNTDASGIAQVTLKHNVAEAAQVVASAGTSGSINAPSVTFKADENSATIGAGALTVDKDTLVANNIEIATYTALVKDSGGNPVPNLTVTWTTDKGTLSAPTSSTDATGKATITLKGTVAGEAQVTASVNGTAPVNADKVTFKADGTTAKIGAGDLSVDTNTIVANNTEIATYTALVKDANGNPVPNFSVGWTTTHGTLSGTSSDTDANGNATITLKGTIMGSAQVVATANGGSENAPLVNLMADITTAKVTTVTSSLAKMTGTGTESSIQTAMVTDANGNILPAGQTVNWSTTIGTMSSATTQTDASGKTTSTLSGTIASGASNGTAIVTAAATAGSNTANVTVRTVAIVGGRSYWTMISDHQTSSQTAAQANCVAYGGGTLVNESDFAPFLAASGGAAFNSKTVSGEYLNNFYRFGDKWTTKSGDFNDAGNAAGGTSDTAGVDYICVK